MLTASTSVVLAVLITVPAVKIARAVREVLIAFAVAAVGAVAAIGFHPLLSLARFEYTTLALSLLMVLVLVYRLGAGLHGLGRRGLVVIVGGGAVLALGLAYAELLRAYGTPGLVSWIFDAAEWSQDNLGGVPRPMQALLGIPMLACGACTCGPAAGRAGGPARSGWPGWCRSPTCWPTPAHPPRGGADRGLQPGGGAGRGRRADQGRPAARRLGRPARRARGGERRTPEAGRTQPLL